MAINKGVAPPDPETLVGQFRYAYGDTEFVELDPVELGYGNYEELSDTDIEVFLGQGRDNVNRGIGYLYLRLSSLAAKKSRSIKDHDLAVDLTKRAEDLRRSAEMYFEQADAEDAASGALDLFDSFRFGGEDLVVPEAAPTPYRFDVY